MKKLAFAAATAALFGLASEAHAGSGRIVLAGPAKDPITSRLQKELTAMGFEPIRVDDAASCATGAITAWVDETKAAGAACSDGAAVTIWIVGRSGLRMTDAVTPREDVEEGPDVIATRAAEIARASLELPATEVDPAFAAKRPPPSWEPDPTPAAVDAAEQRKPIDPRKAPAVAMGAGTSYIFGADAHAVALDLELETRIVHSLSIATRAQIPLNSTDVANGRTVIKVAPAVFGIGPVFALAPPESFFVPRLGGGIGFVWLRSDATGSVVPSSASASSQSSFAAAFPSRDDIFSPMLYASGSASLRLIGPVRFVFEAQLGTTAHRMVVRDEGTNIAYFGQPFGSIAARGELVFR